MAEADEVTANDPPARAPSRRPPGGPIFSPRRLFAGARAFRRGLVAAGLAAIEHDVPTVAQATAYAAIVALFPTLIVAAAVVGLLPDTVPLRVQLEIFFDRVLPSNVSPLVDAYFSTSHRSPQTARALVGSLVVGLTGAAGVMATLMEGFRRAYDLPLVKGSFWPRRIRALALVPLSLLPNTAASLLVVFGSLITQWIVADMTPGPRAAVIVVGLVLRWTVALAGSIGIFAVIYHLGTDLGTDLSTHMREEVEPLLREPWGVLRREWSWRASLPGAALATGLWFVTTLGFGIYVTRFANYSQVYGPLGAAIALLFWLYLIALSVLIGAEFNAQNAQNALRKLQTALCGGRPGELAQGGLTPPIPPAGEAEVRPELQTELDVESDEEVHEKAAEASSQLSDR